MGKQPENAFHIAVRWGGRAVVARTLIYDILVGIELRFGTRDHLPLVRKTVEVQSTSIELELGLPCGNSGPLKAFGHKPEESRTCQTRVRNISARQRMDPTTSRHESGSWIKNHDVFIKVISTVTASLTSSWALAKVTRSQCS
jgi:hypothetical protein